MAGLEQCLGALLLQVTLDLVREAAVSDACVGLIIPKWGRVDSGAD